MARFPSLFLLGTAVAVRMEAELASLGIREDLRQRGVTNTEMAFAIIEHVMDAKFHLRENKKAAKSVVPFTNRAEQEALGLEFVEKSCSRVVEVMGLGSSAESSRSGSLFLRCAVPQEGEKFKRAVLKGGVRDNPVDPEWTTFLAMVPELYKRYEDEESPSLLNKVLVGFDAFDYHWIALDDTKAADLAEGIENVCGVDGKVAFETFDVKPLPSRAPELSDMLLRLKRLGAVSAFEGWARLRSALVKDLAFVDKFQVVDQSLFVQVAGPVKVSNAGCGEQLMEMFTDARRRCAWRIANSELTLVCTSILDYFLSLNFYKALQSKFQSDRWDDYSDKVTQLFDCVGDVMQPACGEYLQIVDSAWLAQRRELIWRSEELKRQAAAKEAQFICCCDVQSSKGVLGEGSPCTWEEKEERRCPEPLDRISVREGGCLLEVDGQLQLSS